ncbi:Hypothetical predicted protein [Lecanosticta acicola]|uniref:Uncharacterized protein n=1 Tax=Lecanosticta acicola TaxID=111012 RepID=A0AAI8Z6Z1_9PEZI|nr:Hypothetical predicted protein [Lecanosticta acicola]
MVISAVRQAGADGLDFITTDGAIIDAVYIASELHGIRLLRRYRDISSSSYVGRDDTVFKNMIAGDMTAALIGSNPRMLHKEQEVRRQVAEHLDRPSSEL